jgi:hypothetical protein
LQEPDGLACDGRNFEHTVNRLAVDPLDVLLGARARPDVIRTIGNPALTRGPLRVRHGLLRSQHSETEVVLLRRHLDELRSLAA